MRRLAGALILGLGLLAPTAAVIAQDHDRNHARHEWSDSESATWHQYLKEHHRKDHEWSKATKREQRAYWKWRDQHPDTH